jgi:hypothetical protein
VKVYNYNPANKVYTFEEEADPDPLIQGRWLVPANATTITPPELREDEIVIFDEEKQKWEIRKVKQPVVPYYILRAREYPPIFEYIDGIVKNDHEQINKYIKACQEVKAKYPKPEIIHDYEI